MSAFQLCKYQSFNFFVSFLPSVQSKHQCFRTEFEKMLTFNQFTRLSIHDTNASLYVCYILLSRCMRQLRFVTRMHATHRAEPKYCKIMFHLQVCCRRLVVIDFNFLNRCCPLCAKVQRQLTYFGFTLVQSPHIRQCGSADSGWLRARIRKHDPMLNVSNVRVQEQDKCASFIVFHTFYRSPQKIVHQYIYALK